MIVVTFIFAFALAFGAAFFAIQNPALVSANFFGYTIEGSLAVFVLIGLGVGFLIGVLVMLPGRIKSGLAQARMRKKMADIEGGGTRKSTSTAAKGSRSSTPDETP